MMNAREHSSILGDQMMQRIEAVSREAFMAASKDPEPAVAMQALVEVYVDMIAVFISQSSSVEGRSVRAVEAAHQLIYIVERMKKNMGR